MVFYNLLPMRGGKNERYISHIERHVWESPINMKVVATVQVIPFSAFWLRSSVVSVLISLIFDMWPIRPHDINLISFMGVALV